MSVEIGEMRYGVPEGPFLFRHWAESIVEWQGWPFMTSCWHCPCPREPDWSAGVTLPPMPHRWDDPAPETKP